MSIILLPGFRSKIPFTEKPFSFHVDRNCHEQIFPHSELTDIYYVHSIFKSLRTETLPYGSNWD